MKLLIILKNAISFFLINIIYKPGKVLLRFVFYKFIVKLYRYYFTIAKKTGWLNKDSSFFLFFRARLVHFILLVFTVGIAIINLTESSNAQSINHEVNKTILASLVESEFNTMEEEELIEEFFDQEASVSSLQQSYFEHLASLRSQPSLDYNEPPEEELESSQSTLNQEGIALIQPDVIETQKTVQPRESATAYVVQQGDTVSTIAQQFNVSVSTILWENDLSAYSLIRPGDTLTILPTSGITHNVSKGESLTSIASRYGISLDQILAANKLAESSQINIGQKLLIPGGRKIAYAAYKPKTYSGLSIIEDLVEKAPIISKFSKPKSSKSSGNRMAWPTAGHRITQYYSWRHHGVDIANKIGTPIYAADAGVIEYAGWGSGYGNQIIVNHGGGKKTRYAHLSRFYVKKGESVSKGEAIGAMGSTGWSTGSHLHFEVMIDGGKYNPLSYIR